ncbi:MAG: transglutaminase family protein [Janthinobacterium lividum]
MRLSIHHQTLYRYEIPLQYSIQQLRLTPVPSATQFVAHWEIQAPSKLEAAMDAYGNAMHTLVVNRPVSQIAVTVSGEIETVPLQDGRLLDGPGRIPLEHFTCATRLTEPDAAIISLAHSVPTLDTPAGLIELAAQIAERVTYTSGVTGVTTGAQDALALGQGVCQDHVHLMLACCRARGVPARYVSGYFDPGDVPEMASHAWADIWMKDQGWISVDVTNARFPSGPYCRLAVGSDYDSAAPVRGTRAGGGAEAMNVEVDVHVVVNQ